MNSSEWKIIHFTVTDSTNDLARSVSADNPGSKMVFVAATQTAGRGRRGHQWSSLPGNLFFSLLLQYDICRCGELALLSSLTLSDVLKDLKPECDISLKWPNDVLLNKAKVSGILLEKGSADDIIIGIGINVLTYPDLSGYPATSLRAAGIEIAPADLLRRYLQKFDDNLLRLQKEGMPELKERWLRQAYKLNEKIGIHLEKKDIYGIFKGLDDNGNLLLATENSETVIAAGEVFFSGE